MPCIVLLQLGVHIHFLYLWGMWGGVGVGVHFLPLQIMWGINLFFAVICLRRGPVVSHVFLFTDMVLFLNVVYPFNIWGSGSELGWLLAPWVWSPEVMQLFSLSLYFQYLPMSPISIASWNGRGLNSAVKKSLVFKCLQKTAPHVCILQETHLVGFKILGLRKVWVRPYYHSSYSNYARGVSILVCRSLPF